MGVEDIAREEVVTDRDPTVGLLAEDGDVSVLGGFERPSAEPRGITNVTEAGSP